MKLGHESHNPQMTRRWMQTGAMLFMLLGLDSSALASVLASADDLLIVDCALPGQIRQLGRATTYVSPRRPVRTTAFDCRVRGGEYVLHDRADLDTALAVWMQQARSGDVEAQSTVGELFERGLGSAPDYASAAVWYRRAAEAGYARAQVNLGHLFERGLGVEHDPRRALAWYRRAAGSSGAIDLETVPDVAPLLAARDQAIRELERQVMDLEREAEALRQQLDATRETLDAGTERAALAQELEQTFGLLQEREIELSRQTGASNALLTELQATRAQLLKHAEPTPEALAAALFAGPEIALIEPAIGATRGLVKIQVADATTQQRVIGQVTAPAGVLSMSVNGAPTTPNAAGVFMAEVAIVDADTDTNILVSVIDQQGKRADLGFTVERLAASPPVSPAAPGARDAGESYALLIGINDYRHLPRLNSPIADVERIEVVLRERYGFRTHTLLDASRYDILSALNDLRARLTSEDRLLVYYAGHGELDEANMRGHWLPVDAEADSTANWLSNVDITDILNVLSSRQVLLVVDSCYSGTLTRSSLVRLDAGLTAEEQRTWLRLMAGKRARVVLTSGGLAPVLDFGGGAHSVFARAFIEALESNTEPLLGRSLYQAVAARVAYAAAGYDFEQIPQYAPISRAGHEAGDFVLQPTL